MVDDSMEISSDRGGDAGDDDIDIDIDITAGQIDEDDILDDATSNVDLAESLFPRPSSLIAVDDVMADDDGTYTMDDADPFQDEQEQRMDDENIEMFFAPLDGSNFESNEEYFTGSAAVDTSAPVGEGAWEQEGGGSQENIEDVEESNFEDPKGSPQTHTNADHQAEADSLTETLENETVPPVSNDYVHNVQDSTEHSPPTRSPKDPTEHDLATISGPDLARHSSSRQNSVHSSNAGDGNAIASAETETGNIDSSDSSADLSTLPDVVVVYQSMEYALFGASDSEDPDSFFLTDISIFDKPISDFFKAMRDVVHDDLSPEEELCLSVDDLGLEIEETVSPLHDVTLAQISQTYEKLLHNDGVDMSRPLCLSVGTRPSFARRLTSLVACAAGGKGLSQVITLDEQPSEGFDESGPSKEDLHSDVGAESANGNIIIDNNDQFISNQTEDSENDIPPTNAEADQELPKPGYDQQEERQEEVEADERGSLTEDTQQQAVQHDDLLDTQESPKNDPHSSAHVEEEEGDLIDYSEDEDHVEVEQRSPGSQITQAPANGNIKNDVHETLNEDLRPGSASQAIEQIITEETKEQTPNQDNEANGEENILQLEAGVPYDLDDAGQWNDGDPVEYDGLSNEYMNPTAVGGAEEERDGSIPESDEAQIIESSVTTAPGAQPALEEVEDTEENDYATFEGEHSPEDQVTEQNENAFQDHSESWDLSNIQGTNGEGTSHEFIDPDTGATDAANSSATLSADEHQDKPKKITGAVGHVDIPTSPEHSEATISIPVEDEISYEDDEDEQDTIQIEGPGTQDESSANYGGPGKRTRADNDSDDSASTRDKETKRHRS